MSAVFSGYGLYWQHHLTNFSFSADYFKETDSEGRDAVHSAIQRLQRDSDRDVRFFAGVDEDALDVVYEDTSVHAAAEAEYNLQDTSSTPQEEIELENQTPEDGYSEEHLDEKYSDNLENRTETGDSIELLEGSDHMSLDESSVEATDDVNAVHEFEENERRLDDEFEDAAANSRNDLVEEENERESAPTEEYSEETSQPSEVLWKYLSINNGKRTSAVMIHLSTKWYRLRYSVQYDDK